MKLFHAAGRALNASRMSGSIMNLSCDGGNAARPLSVISPRVSSRRHRSLFYSVHLLFLERRLIRCSVVPPMFFTVESIHPKHRASSTASRYHRMPSCGGVFPRFTAVQHSVSLSWFSTSHFLKELRQGAEMMFTGVIFA